MTSPLKPWETSNSLQNASSQHIQSRLTPALRENVPGLSAPRSAPVLPPLPRNSPLVPNGGASAYGSMPYSSSYGYGGGLGGMPYQSSMYNSYGGYGGLGGYGSSYGGYGGYGGMNSYGMYGGVGSRYLGDDTERRFVQYAEESSRNTFASVESIVRAFGSLSMMLDNTFFAMTSSFRAVLSVAENFGKLRNMFGQIWHSVSIFRLFTYLYRKVMALFGYRVPKSAASAAWNQAAGAAPSGGSSWPTLAFLGVLVSAPYIISKFMPKYEDKCNPNTWKSPGIRAKAAFDFMARASNELNMQTNDEVILAPTSVQEELGLKNSGWAFAVAPTGKSGVVPLNYLLINKSIMAPNNNNNNNSITVDNEEVPIPRIFGSHKTHTKRVSFGENQIFENVDLEDYVTGKKEIKDNKHHHHHHHHHHKEDKGDPLKPEEVKKEEVKIEDDKVVEAN